MKLHVFNPEHDIALAYNRDRLTMPHAAQELRMNMGWLPALWANDGDVVLVDDVEYAVKAARNSRVKTADVLFLSREDVRQFPFDEVRPWGWDSVIATQLLESGICNHLIPNKEDIRAIRELSHRKHTNSVLKTLRNGIEYSTCGCSIYTTSLGEVEEQIKAWHSVVLKAPWSSSGRGIRYVNGCMTENLIGWLRRILHQQGGVMIEPYYNKVKDFGMEFMAHKDGTISYSGLSLFKTINGAYAGNILATDSEKKEILKRYLPQKLINTIIERIVQCFPSFIRNAYVGAFGIDMMIVAKDDGQGFLLHPCVEINLRRTMGHVALALTPADPAPHRLMTIEHKTNYKLKISLLENNYVQTL